MRLITNSNKENDRMFKHIQEQSDQTDVWIAVAFFSHYEMLEYMVEHGCNVFLIVRLGKGTDPASLKKALSLKNVSIRFFTGRSFHPKIYIFGNRKAYVGSSNFTKSGLQTNQEVNVEIDNEEPVFDEVVKTFTDYWDGGAEPLTAEHVRKFAEICQQGKDFDPFQLINNQIGEFEFNNVGREGFTRDKNSTYVSAFRKRYQVYISRFNTLREEYEGTGQHKFPEVPIRIEIDRFLWWIREYKATGDSFQIGQTRIGDELHSFVEPLIREFLSDDDPYLEEHTVPRFKEIAQGFASREKIESMDTEALYENLLQVYAFSSRFRHFKGGHDNMKQESPTAY